MDNVFKIVIIWNEGFDTYSVAINDNIVMECLSQDEVEALTIKQLIDIDMEEV